MHGCVLVAALLLAQAARAQDFDRLFPKTVDPMGTVSNDAGEPIDDAAVSVVLLGPPEVGFLRGSEHLLREIPLPATRSRRDGAFVLPVSGTQRLLGAFFEMGLGVQVESSGYQGWTEPIGLGLHGYVGSQVVLRTIREGDALHVKVEGHPSGSALLLFRVLGEERREVLWTELNPDGELLLELPLLPNPAVVAVPSILDVGYEAFLVGPGFCDGPRALEADDEPYVWNCPEPIADTESQAEGLRGLYRCPDGRLRWLPPLPESLPAGWKLEILEADGHAMSRAGEPLAVLPEEDGEITLRVTNEDGRPLPGAVVRSYPITAWPVDGDFLRLFSPDRDRIRSHSAGANGTVSLGRVDPRERRFLVLEAPGHEPEIVLDPRRLVGEQAYRLQAPPHGSLGIHIAASDGGAVRGAHLLFSDGCYRLGGLPGRFPTTDQTGSLTISSIPPGQHRVRVLADGYLQQEQSFEVVDGKRLDLTLTLESAQEIRAVSTDEDGEPQPFIAYSRVELGEDVLFPGYGTYFMSDSLGRLWLRRVPVRADLKINQLSGNSGVQRRFRSDEPDVRLLVEERPLAFVRTTPGIVLNQVARLDASGGMFSNVPRLTQTYSGLLMTMEAGETTSRGVEAGPLIRITPDMVASAPAAYPQGPKMIDSREVVRRIRIEATDENGERIEGFRVEPSVAETVPILGFGDMTVAGSESGRTWSARDVGPYDCVVLHPQFLPKRLQIPRQAMDGEEGPLHVQLERGTPVVFRVRLPRPRDPDSVITFTVKSPTLRRGLILWQRYPENAHTGNPIDFKLPMALPVGTHGCQIYVPYDEKGQRQRIDLEIEVRGTVPVFVEKDLRDAGG